MIMQKLIIVYMAFWNGLSEYTQSEFDDDWVLSTQCKYLYRGNGEDLTTSGAIGNLAGTSYLYYYIETECNGTIQSHSNHNTHSCLWFIGKVFARCGLPSLVGEIGLVLLVLEAGIDVSIGHLKVVGFRGLSLAIFGSMIPLGIGTGLATLYGENIQSSFAIGACLAPTSMGIALNVLKKAKLLNTPTGQLIIAAAILDDVIALIILSELQAMASPSAASILLPLIVSPILIVGIGYLAIRWIPIWIKMLMNKVASEYRENVILALLFLATFAFVPMCHFLGSSHLLGAFLAGLCFCTDHTIHHVWHHQIKRVLQWMLRIFFSATIGFAIPIRDFTSGAVLFRGLVYCLCGIGKIVTGFYARPLTSKEFCIVGFSMSAWGEFAFILATASYAEGTIDQESFSAVLLAVLLSVIYSPYALAFTISYYEKKAQKRMDENIAKYEDTNLHPVYFAINTKARGQWGHQDKLLHKIFHLGFEIVDFRSWHAPEYNTSHTEPLTKESFYVMDTKLALPPTKHLDAVEKSSLKDRVKSIRNDLREALGEKAVINIKRWLPGVTKSDDELEPTDDYVKAMFGGESFRPKHKKTAEYCRTAAFKQAHSIMSVFERKNTLQDLARRSKASLHSMHSMRSMSDLDRKATMEELGKIVSLTNLWGDNPTSPRSNKTNDMDNDDDHSLSFSDSPQPGHGNKKSNPISGSGFNGASAGGAGAVPVSNDIINLYSHFDEGNNTTNNNNNNTHNNNNNNNTNNKRDESYMSYIYGDEDSEHHKLPEYSNEHLQEQIHFEPKLPELIENDNEEKFHMNDAETSDQETDDSKNNNHKYHHEHHETNQTLISIDTPDTNTIDTPHTNNSNIDMDLVNNVMNMNEQNNSTSSKLTIKIYPPALQAVASRSPVESDENIINNNTPQHYID
eukprot:681308_1